MGQFYFLGMDLFSLFVCLLLLTNAGFGKRGIFEQHRLMSRLTIINAVMLVLSAAFKLTDAKAGTAAAIVSAGAMFIGYLAIPAAIYLEILYVCCETETGRHWPLMRLYTVPAFVLAACVVGNLFTHGIYFFDDGNVYVRAGGFAAYAAACFILQAVPLAVLYFRRKGLEARKLAALAAFCLIPLMGAVLEIVNQKAFSVWDFFSLSLLLMYFYIERVNLNTDYLTGIFNRLHLDEYIKRKIKNAGGSGTFCGILLDIDNFKEINDTLGHQTGDEALEVAACLLKSSIAKSDFLARFGGDEFVILKNVADRGEMLDFVRSIELRFENFNRKSGKNYLLCMSMGFDIYNGNSGMTYKQFFKHIDEMMYENKRFRKQEAENQMVVE